MTAYASGKGEADGYSWSWDLRSVNGRGLDLRLRTPDWVDGLDAALRARLQRRLHRGNVTVSLRLANVTGGGLAALDECQLDAVIAMVGQIERRAASNGLPLRQSSAADILAIRGVYDASRGEDDPSALRETVIADFEGVLGALLDMREAEGSEIEAVITRQLTEIAALTDKAEVAAGARGETMKAILTDQMARLLETTDLVDEARLAQELALLAVKADVTEELDRLRAHVAAARALIAGNGPHGRKLEFLVQEFNREANTLCSKAQSQALTAIGLDLKAVIDQLREQALNVE